MMKKAISFGIVGLFVIGGLVGIFFVVPDEVQAPGPTYVSGLITENITWTVDGSPYIIIGDILVEDEFNLTIEPGVVVKFDTDKYLRIDGTLYAVGNETNMILFTSNNSSPMPGDWGGIRITETSVNSLLKYCKIEYGGGADGGGINNAANDFEIRDCIFINNSASNFGGGIYNTGSNLRIYNSRIEKNSAWKGGGICNEDGAYLIINNSEITENYGQDNGGGLYNDGVMTINYCNIFGNSVTWSGGGIRNRGAAILNIRSANISENSATYGSGIFNGGSSTIEYSTISKNVASNSGGGIHNQGSASLLIKNTTISGNSASITGGGIHNAGVAIININYSIIIENTASSKGGGIYNYESTDVTIRNSNICLNTNYSIYNEATTDVIAPNNWWGTTDRDQINQSIFDFYDDFSFGEVIFEPFLNSPVSENVGGLQPGAPWPMFRGNVRHTGLSPYDTSGNTGELKWSFPTGFRILSSPIIGSDGTIYITSGDFKLYAINPNGTEKWNFLTGWHAYTTPAIGSDGTLYFISSDNKTYAINSDGTEKWNFPMDRGGRSSPAIGSDGTIYVGSYDNKLYAINPNGTEKWNFTTGDMVVSSPAISSDGTIYVGSYDNKLYAINPNGTQKWNFTTGDTVESSPAIGSDGTIYIGSRDNKLYAIHPNGTQYWSFTTGWFISSSPAIGSDGTVYIGSYDGKFYAINPNGTGKWDFTTGDTVESSPAIGLDGTVYVGSSDNKLYAINPNGTEKWSYMTGSSVESSPAIGSDGTIYVGSRDYYLYAIGTDISNSPPSNPSTPSGPILGITNTSYSFSTSATDPDGDQIKYGWDWDGNGTVDEWSGLVDSGTVDSRSHSWSVPEIYNIQVKAQDEHGEESGWSGVHSITIVYPENGSGLQAGAPWPMFRQNLNHTGLSPYDTSGNPGELKWTYTLDRRHSSSPAIGSDGTVYVTSEDFKLYAINPNGTEKWNFMTGWHVHSSPAIGSDGTIYFISQDNNTYAINSDGTEKWSLSMDMGGRSSPAIGSDGTIYVGSYDNKLYAINPDGSEKWNFTTGDVVSSSPAIGIDGTIYVGSIDNKLYAINPDGSEKWTFTTGSGIESSPSIGSDGTIYIGSRDYKLYAINPDGSEKWSYLTGYLVISSPAISSDGTIYIGSSDNKLYAINPDGTEKWNYTTDNWVESSPAIGSDGTIYVGSDDSNLYAINQNGSEKWSFNTDSNIRSSPAIGSDGTIYIASREGTLYAIGESPNQSPLTPSLPSGPPSGITNTSYSFSTSATDPDGDQIKYGWDWDGDGTVDEWSGFVDSGVEDNRSHSWSTPGIYDVKVKAQDEHGAESGWSPVLIVTITAPIINEPPTISNCPDINIRFNISYTFDYSPYINDIDTPKESLILTTSEPTVDGGNGYAVVNGLNVTYRYPESRVAETILVILTVSDGEGSNNDTIEITIIDKEPDFDGDGIPDSEDPDDDNDGYNDDIDSFPFDQNEWLDTDSDGTGNNEDTDDDGDTFSDDIDAFPLDHLEWLDTDSDGIGNNADPDDDNDGHNDIDDYYPLDPTRWSPLTEISILSITVSNESPTEGDEITINVQIQNSDGNDNNIIVKFYDGDPSLGGTQIGSSQEVNIPSDSPLSISQTWIATSGNHTLFVVIGHNETIETITSSLTIAVSEELIPQLVLSVGDINMYRFEPGQERTIFVEVTCYYQTLDNVHLVVLDNQNLTIDHTITPPRTMLDGETTKFYLRIKAPQLPEGVEKLEWDITIQAQGDNGISSNSEELDIVVSQNAVSFFNPVTIAGAVATGSLATLGAAAAASRRNENWKYLLLLSFAVPLYTRIHGKKTLDNFVRGQVFGHIQSKPGTHFNEIKKTLQLGNGNLAYHLQKLEKEGFVKSKRNKRFRRFYPVGVTVPEEDGIKLSKTQETMLDHIERHPHSTQKEIAENLKESQQTISYNINVLVREGFMREEKIKGIKKYKLIDENT